MRVTFDPAKRAKTLAERGLDFEDAAIVFQGRTVEIEDTRRDYGEKRVICYGLLSGRLVVIGYAPRGAAMLGIAWADVEAKYRALGPFAKFAAGNLDASMQAIRDLRRARSVSELIDLLH